MGLKGYVFILLIFSGLYACEREVLTGDKKEVTVLQESGQDSILQRNQDLIEQERLDSKIEESNFNFWKVIAIVSLILNGILIFITRKLIQSKRKKRNSFGKGTSEDVIRSRTHSNPSESLSLLKDEIPPPNSKTEKSDNPINSLEDTEEERTVEIELSVNTSNAQEVENRPVSVIPVVLFAEKAMETGVFSNVSEKLDPYKSYFKFTLSLDNKDKAEFEVLDSEFILKKGANQPDLYLYTVCDPENSNQNFTGEIVTIKKGIAELVNDNWQVKKGNKAKIKFQ